MTPAGATAMIPPVTGISPASEDSAPLMLSFLTFLLLSAALLHLTVFIYNRYLICIPPSLYKKPVRYLWFFLAWILPTLAIVVFRNHPQIASILEWRPTRESLPLFFAAVAIMAFFGARKLIWLQERILPLRVKGLVKESVSPVDLDAPPPKVNAMLAPFVTTTDLEVIEREIQIPGLSPAFDGFTIAHVTDVHFGRGQGLEKYLDAVVEAVGHMAADVVALTGDFSDRRRDIPEAVAYHQRFRARLGALCVLGNHDYWTRPDALLEELRGSSIKWLGSGERRVLKRGGRRLIFCGTDAPWDHSKVDYARLFRKGAGDAIVFLSHTPDNAPEAIAQGASLVLAGHVHGGQVCLPLIGPVICPSRYGTRYAAGLFSVGSDGGLLHVSRGVGVSSAGTRILCPPDVTLLRLRAPSVEVMVGATARQRLFRPLPSQSATGETARCLTRS